MLVVVDEFITGNTHPSQSLEEGVDRTIAHAGNVFFYASNGDSAFKTAMYATIGLVELGEAMAYKSIFALQIDVFLFKEVHNLLAGELVAIGIGSSLHNIAKLGMHFLGQVVAHSLLQHKSSTALAGLAVDANNGLVFTMQIGRIDG